MNEFIELRQSSFDHEDAYDFSKKLLERYQLTSEGELFLDRFNDLVRINDNDQADEASLIKLLSFLGEDDYIDRYTMDTIIQMYHDYPREEMINILKVELKNDENKSKKTYQLLDLVLEFNFDLLSKETIYHLIEKNKENFDIISLLIEYIGHFRIELSKEFLYEQLTYNYPTTIKIQILNVLDKIYSIENLNLDYIKEEIETEDNQSFMIDYIDFLKDNYKITKKGVVLLQSMFYGDFENSGEGNNGGLAILLKSLGNEISNDDRIDKVITITITDATDNFFVVNYQEDHLFIRLPIYLDRTVMDPFLKRELFIKRSIKSFLDKLTIQPDIFHIRYLDNASMAVAKLSKELDKKLVLTVAPDPHRNMSDKEGYLKHFDFDQMQFLLNKIKIGDQLIFESNKILGIGEIKNDKELKSYFPQLSNKNMDDKMKMIAEGIKITKKSSENNKDLCVSDLEELIGIDSSFCDRPIILNVGRLAKLKGQISLFKAWSKSKLNESHNLLIIGGNLKNPNQEEKEIIDFFAQQLKEHPELRDKFFHEGALHNKKIKLVESSIMNRRFDYPHIYLASSIKEEFGIAILEAMHSGFLILAPIKGGVKNYVRNRENGFLIDTSTYQSIAESTEEIIYNSNISDKEFNQIQQAGIVTIEKRFSIDKIARTFIDSYLSLLGGQENEL